MWTRSLQLALVLCGCRTVKKTCRNPAWRAQFLGKLELGVPLGTYALAKQVLFSLGRCTLGFDKICGQYDNSLHG